MCVIKVTKSKSYFLHWPQNVGGQPFSASHPFIFDAHIKHFTRFIQSMPGLGAFLNLVRLYVFSRSLVSSLWAKLLVCAYVIISLWWLRLRSTGKVAGRWMFHGTHHKVHTIKTKFVLGTTPWSVSFKGYFVTSFFIYFPCSIFENLTGLLDQTISHMSAIFFIYWHCVLWKGVWNIYIYIFLRNS